MYTTATDPVKRSKKIRVKSKVRFTLFILVIILSATFLLHTSLSSEKAAAQSKQITKTITVSCGDTLWDIAKCYQNNVSDVREAVYIIKQANNLTDSNIKAGTEIIIPISDL